MLKNLYTNIKEARTSFLFSTGETDPDKINKSRIEAYDILRGLAVLLMILIHIVHEYAGPNVENSVVGYVIEFLGGPPAAPTFMMLMGIFFIYSNKGTFRLSLLRGLNLLLIAFVLNLVRGILPYYILTQLNGVSPDSLGIYFRMEYLIFEVDILTFAGISYMIMTILYHFVKKPVVWLAFAVAIAVGSPLLWRIAVTQLPLQYVTNVFWGDEYLSTFPVFPWLSFPLVGMVIGRLLKERMDHRKVINKLGIYSVFFIIAGGALMLINVDYFYNAYGKMGVGAIIGIIGFVFFWQWLITKIYKVIGGKFRTGMLQYLSKNVLYVYFLHWVLCKWGVVFFGIDSMGYADIFAMFAVVTALSMILTRVYLALNNKQVLHTP